MTTKARVDYVELSVANGSKAKAFYAAALGWSFQDWGAEYIAFNDGTRDAGGFRVESGGGKPLVITYADDLNAVREQVTAAGGRIVGPDHVFPGGRRFHFLDPFGNELAVWTREPDKSKP